MKEKTNMERSPQDPRSSKLKKLLRIGDISTDPSDLNRGEWKKGKKEGREITGVITDQKLLQYFYARKGVEVHPIATDSFLDKSRDEYNSAWLTRELVQNFVDHNPDHPGTLDGVQFTSEPLADGGRRFIIEGQWSFADPTGILSPHSEKPEDMNTAGGNGIGLKQTAIRLLRDFGVKRFEIVGEGWTTNYRLAKAAEINDEWANPQYKVKHDWLLADIKETAMSGKNAYIIETDSPEVIYAIEQLPTLGVSQENPYLQDLDYESRFGGIKWLPKSEGDEPTRGRLFINGQVMNYKEKGATAEEYWVGPEFVTIQLNNLRYDMSIDRPPVDPYALSSYLDDIVRDMSKDDTIEQLKRSEHLWAGSHELSYGSEKKGAFVVVEKLARLLPYKRYDTEEYQEHFAGKNYLALDSGVSLRQVEELEGQGYIICPGYLEQIGMPIASSMLSSVEAASNEIPRSARYKREELAQEYGMEVSYEEFSDISNPEEFIAEVGKRLSGQVSKITQREGNIIRLSLQENIDRDLLFHPLPKPQQEDQKLVYFLRGMAAYGLDKEIFHKIFTSQGEFVTTFGLEYDHVTAGNSLIARNISNKNNQGTFVEIELSEAYSQQFQKALREKDKEDVTAGVSDGSDENSVRKGVGNIPVEHPDMPESGVQRRVIHKKATMSATEQERVAELEQKLPGIVAAVENLEQLVPQREYTESSGETPVEKYLQWRESDQFYGQLGDAAGYLTGRHLIEIIEAHDKADIATVQVVRKESATKSELDALQSKLKGVLENMGVQEDAVDDFEIVLTPTEKQLAQLGLLRLYSQFTTEVAIPNDLFIYKGTGSKGVNIGQKAIGIHEALFEADFPEAMRTFIHELAHNFPEADDHGVMFRHTMESLFTTVIDRVTDIALKTESGQAVTPEERSILDMQKTWQKLLTTEE